MSHAIVHLAIGYPKRDMMEVLERSSRMNGFEFVGLPATWPRRRIRTIDKMHLCKHYLAARYVSPEQIVMFTDAYDVLVIGHQSEVLRKFHVMNADLVFNAEANFFPEENRSHVREQFDAIPSKHRYLNSGCYIGYAWAIEKMLDDCLSDAELSQSGSHSSDQELAQNFFLAHQDSDQLVVRMDTETLIFAPLLHCMDDFILDRAAVFSLLTGTAPAVLHANGDKRNIFALRSYAELAAAGRQAPPDLRMIKIGGQHLDYDAEAHELRPADGLSENSVFLAVRGDRQAVAFTPARGCLTFTEDRRVENGRSVVLPWEVLTIRDGVRSAHGFTLREHIRPATQAELILEPLRLGLFVQPFASDFVKYARTYLELPWAV